MIARFLLAIYVDCELCALFVGEHAALKGFSVYAYFKASVTLFLVIAYLVGTAAKAFLPKTSL